MFIDHDSGSAPRHDRLSPVDFHNSVFWSLSMQQQQSRRYLVQNRRQKEMGKSYKWKKAAVSYISCYAGIIHRGGNLCRCSAFKASSIFIAIHPTQTPSLSLQFLGLFNSQLSMTCCQNQLSYNWMGPCMHLEHLGCGTTQDISYGTMQQTRYSMVTEEGPTGSAKESKSGEDMPRNAVSADGENSHSPNILP